MGLFFALAGGIIGLSFLAGILYLLKEQLSIKKEKQEIEDKKIEERNKREKMDIKTLKRWFDYYEIYNMKEREFLYKEIPNSKYFLVDDEDEEFANDLDNNILFFVSTSVEGLSYELLECLAKMCSKTVFGVDEILIIAKTYSVKSMELLYELVKADVNISEIWDTENIPTQIQIEDELKNIRNKDL